ncbi:SDR family oxidoreductase [Asanoa sp. WMMD1127]|uniref:SDR family oxidoreductase n=1 Tax=Asanoa sp. WMMD1127 TaxID=3016107 RepID=UPI002415A683|nr:SDR family oxidoreductase [Asanoa sp. WMMD1127]MDG4825271.1 SDR family oxidoreductase [Asanoa sp. WMMD1127]
MESLEGRVFVVTGGGSGIGRCVALRLAELGAAVAIAGRRAEKLDAVAAEVAAHGGQALAVPTDVRQPDQVDALVGRALDRFGQVDGLVNNAAGNFVVPAEKLSANGWRAVVDIVLNGTWYCTSAVGRALIESGRPGAILSVVATYAWIGHPGTVHSAAAKAGVVTMTRTLAAEWARYGIRLNCIAPGPTTTDGAGAALWATPEDHARVLSSVPAARFAEPAEIADLCGLLLSDRAGYVTGEVLTADGGQSLGRQFYGPPLNAPVPTV